MLEIKDKERSALKAIKLLKNEENMNKLINHPFIWLVLIIGLATLVYSQISFIEHPVAEYYNNPWSAFAIDMDYDNDIDVVGSGRFGNSITWFENDGNFSFQPHDISTSSYYAMVVHAIDIDNDNDVDVLCASQNNGVELWENNGNQEFTRHIIADWQYASYISVGDVDSDQDMDVLVCCCEGGMNRIGWIENTGNLNFTPHIVISDWNHANSVCAANLDLDQDTDLIGTASYAGEVAWFENDGNQSFTKHNIFETWARPSCAETADIDSDDDIDIVATVCYLNQVLWFENDGFQTFAPRVIDSNFTRPHQVRTADLDNDDDIDVIATAIDNDQIAWWENGEGNPVQWTKHVITDNFNGATGIHIFDIDRDNDLDVLGAAQFGNKISWWENVPAGIEEKSITQLKQPNPIPTILSNQLKLEENKNWKFYDIIGRNISTNNIKPGVYLLVIDGIIAQKVIKIK